MRASQLVFGAGVLLAATAAGCDCGGGGAGGGDGSVAAEGGGPDGGGDADAPSIPGLLALRIEPASATVVDDGVAPGETTSFVAIGDFADGDREVTAEVAWSLADAGLGTIAAGAFTSAGLGGETEVVAAAAGGIQARATLLVRLEVARVVGDAPADAASRFPPATGGDLVDEDDLLVVYPSHETLFPRNLERVLHQWRAAAALDLFELRFDSEVATLRFYTTARTWLPDASDWAFIAHSHAGRELVFTVRGVDRDGAPEVYRSAPVTLLYSPADVVGALYYWSTGARGVMKATISSALASKFYTDPAADDAGTCVACHTVSRDGRRLAVGYGGEKLREVSVPDFDVYVPVDPTDDGPPYGWGTFSPDGTRLLYANRGALTLLDADSAAVLDAVELPAGTFGATPDWAPNGEFVALAYVSGDGEGTKNKSLRGSSLARLPVLADGSFGAPEILVPSTDAEDTISFPAYSPDSAWIAFARTVGSSKDSEASELLVVAADGSGAPLSLTRLNERVRHEDGITGVGNAMPTWAPAIAESPVFFLAFSSLRDYGDVLVGAARDQLWGAAFLRDAPGGTGDRSYAAFWMPFQSLDEGNHRAFWAHDAEEVCPSDREVCDGLDNDCDGVVDEDCCTPDDEVCDSEDNDCDGVVDEGCGCTELEEICDDGLDNDCDGDIDSDDDDCLI